MYDCAKAAHRKINAYAAVFMEQAAGHKGEMLGAIEIMRGRIGTKTPHSFPELSAAAGEIAAAFWNPVTAAYAYCQREQRHIVATAIAQTLDRLVILLERENG